MNWLIGVGGTTMQPVQGRFDFFPLLIIAIVLVVVRLVLGIRLWWPVVLGATAGGTLLAGAIEAWGVGIPTAVALTIGVVASAILHRQARSGA